MIKIQLIRYLFFFFLIAVPHGKILRISNIYSGGGCLVEKQKKLNWYKIFKIPTFKKSHKKYIYFGFLMYIYLIKL